MHAKLSRDDDPIARHAPRRQADAAVLAARADATRATTRCACSPPTSARWRRPATCRYARRAQPAAVGTGPRRLVPGVLDRAQPAARARRRRADPTRRAPAPLLPRRRRAVRLQPACRTPALAAAACPMRRARWPTCGAGARAHAGAAARRRRRRRRRAVLLPPGAAARRHAPRGRALHGAAPGLDVGDRAGRPAPLPRRRRRAELAVAGGDLDGSARATAASRSTTNSARTTSSVPAFAIDAQPVTWARLPALRRGRRLRTTPRWWTRRRLGLAPARSAARLPRYLRAATAAAGSSGASAAGPTLDLAAARRAPQPARSRRPGAAGPAAACRPKPSGSCAAAPRGRATSTGARCGSGPPAPFAPYPGFAPHPYRDYSAALVRRPPGAARRARSPRSRA